MRQLWHIDPPRGFYERRVGLWPSATLGIRGSGLETSESTWAAYTEESVVE